MSDLAVSLRAVGESLRPHADPELGEGLELVRLRLGVKDAIADWEFDHRRPRGREGRKSGWRNGPPRCPVCKLFVTGPDAECASCGYSPATGFRR